MATARVIGRTTAGNGSPELLTISGTGSVAMTNTPTLVTPVLGEATATSINGITITAGGSGTLTMLGNVTTSVGGFIRTSGTGGFIDTSNVGGFIDTNSAGGNISTAYGGGGINTAGTGSIELGVTNTRTTFTGAASGSDKAIALPNLSGTVVVTASVGTTATHALFANTTGFPAYRAIATADIATALTTPGAIGGTTAGTGAFTTLAMSGKTTVATGQQLMLVNSGTTTTQPTLYSQDGGGGQGILTFGSFTTNGVTPLYGGIGGVPAYINCYAAVLYCSYVAFQPGGGLKDSGGNVALTVTATQAIAIPGTLAVTGATTMTGRLTANGGITVVGGSYLLTTNSNLTNGSGSSLGTLTNAPDSGNPTKWIAINDNGIERYIPTWTQPP
jgi:hypothetical protein